MERKIMEPIRELPNKNLHFQFFFFEFVLDFETNNFIEISCTHFELILPFKCTTLEFELITIFFLKRTKILAGSELEFESPTLLRFVVLGY